MATKLTIAYAGTLSDYQEYSQSLEDSLPKKGIKGAVQTYRNINVDWSSRTGYYIIHAAKVFKEKYPHLVDSLEISIWGSISKGNLSLAAELEVEDIVKIEGFIPHAESIKRIE